jgi:hypothetical protein
MHQLSAPVLPRRGAVSPLVLSDRLIALAQDADRAGYTGTAEQLIHLACSVFDEDPRPRHWGKDARPSDCSAVRRASPCVMADEGRPSTAFLRHSQPSRG